MAKTHRPDDQPNFMLRIVMRIAGVLFVIFCIAVIVNSQNQIAEKKLEVVKIQEEIDKITLENDELRDIINSDDIGRYMEKLAVENISNSYAYPDERRYYDTSRD